MTWTNNITIIAAINNQSVAASNLLRSPLIEEDDVQFFPTAGFSQISLAYNHGIMQATGELLVFCHQDVYIPSAWRQRLLDAVTEIELIHPTWAVLGVVGVNDSGFVKGRAWSTGLGKEIGVQVKAPEPAFSLDELTLVLRRDAGLLFDENMPGWHLYGTDIVLQALERGLGAYIIHAPVIHNSLPIIRLDTGFVECCYYLRRKWSHRLPIKTCCIKITRFGWPLFKKRIRQQFISTSRNSFTRLPDPVEKARELGYE